MNLHVKINDCEGGDRGISEDEEGLIDVRVDGSLSFTSHLAWPQCEIKDEDSPTAWSDPEVSD